MKQRNAWMVPAVLVLLGACAGTPAPVAPPKTIVAAKPALAPPLPPAPKPPAPTPAPAPPKPYQPPAASAALLAKVEFGKAKAIDEDYREQFVTCDGDQPGGAAKDTFRGHALKQPNVSDGSQQYLCSRDKNKVRALLQLADGAVYWESKMALDVDGSWTVWQGVKSKSDQPTTAYQWKGLDPAVWEAQVDPDRFPFVVMPTSGIRSLTGDASTTLGREFAQKTGLALGDMGVAIYRDKWTPVFIADGGPFMRLGEGSAAVFEALGQPRCRGWDAGHTRCLGDGIRPYPYDNFGVEREVVFILYPGSRRADFTPETAMPEICAFAKDKLGLAGSGNCPE